MTFIGFSLIMKVLTELFNSVTHKHKHIFCPVTKPTFMWEKCSVSPFAGLISIWCTAVIYLQMPPGTG